MAYWPQRSKLRKIMPLLGNALPREGRFPVINSPPATPFMKARLSSQAAVNSFIPA